MRDLAEAAGYSYRRLFDINNALPANQKFFVKSENGKKYDLATFVQRWVAYCVQDATSDRGKDLETVKAEHEAVKKRKTELEVARMEGSQVDTAEVARLWAEVANTVMQNMLRVPTRVSPRITGMTDPEAVMRIIEGEIREVLEKISDAPVPVYLADGDNVDEENEEE